MLKQHKTFAGMQAWMLGTAMAFIAGSVHADTSRLDILVSKDGVNFASSIAVNPDLGETRVYVKYVMSYVGTTASPNALAALTFQPVFSNVVVGVDSMAPFALRGNNSNGGSIEPRADYSSAGGFGRLKPWAATGPSTSQAYVTHVHSAGSGGAPAGTYFRVARNDITRWAGTGPTTGTASTNNFNGAGGMVCGQKQSPNASDPPRLGGTQNLPLMVLALNVGLAQPGQPRTIIADAPTDGMSRVSATGQRAASWWANTTENAASIRADVVVVPGEITVTDALCPEAILAGTGTATIVISQGSALGLDAVLTFAPTSGDRLTAGRWYTGRSPTICGPGVSGCVTPNLFFNSFVAAHQGLYRFRSECGIESNEVSLSCRPVILTQPQGGSTNSGSEWRVFVETGNDEGASFQWKHDGVRLVDSAFYSGVTGRELTVFAETLPQSGEYTVEVTNACGTTASTAAVLDLRCAADFNIDGGIDGSDIGAFFEKWEAGEPEADLSHDGAVDGLDVSSFFDRWVGGC